MTLWNLTDPAVQELRNLPETGMGFQWVSAQAFGRRIPVLVLNSSLAIDFSDRGIRVSDDPAQILANGLRIIEVQVELEAPINIFAAPTLHNFELLSTRIETRAEASGRASAQGKITLPSSLVKRINLPASRIFHRFSAYHPDRRVDPLTGSLAPGSYAVPESEVPFIPTGFAAVGRLALPNVQPASHHYQLRACSGTPVAFGTVAPAFGQAGGGVEAYFPKGAVNVATPAKATQIPDE